MLKELLTWWLQRMAELVPAPVGRRSSGPSSALVVDLEEDPEPVRLLASFSADIGRNSNSVVSRSTRKACGPAGRPWPLIVVLAQLSYACLLRHYWSER